MIEVTGKVAHTVVEGLKTQPLALPLVVINVLCLCVIGYVLYVVAARTVARDELIVKLAHECKLEVSK
jgi:hypothetical protein